MAQASLSPQVIHRGLDVAGLDYQSQPKALVMDVGLGL